ncbi:MAG: hypothetical protein RSG59_01725 [Ruthenibacterium sp.]
MVALLPAAGALRDALLAAGLGFLLGLFYRALRFVLGDTRAACFVCDVLLLAAAAVLYRAAAAGSFAAGIMRWYTAAAAAVGYALCQKIFFQLFTQCAAVLRLLLMRPFHAAYRYILCPVGTRIGHAVKKYWAVAAAKRAAVRKKRKRDLQKGQYMLYNSQ